MESCSLEGIFSVFRENFSRNRYRGYLIKQKEREKDLRSLLERVKAGGALTHEQKVRLDGLMGFFRSFSHLPWYPADEMEVLLDVFADCKPKVRKPPELNCSPRYVDVGLVR
ncbi:MAG TPA: hypothetical protein PKA63_14325 [Oligoflexia bacterium]|nr:hypothetical protein [Oligoflexia bacterium]HMP49841.1 hypothetical protein [Oligoflexia bacterium]